MTQHDQHDLGSASPSGGADPRSGTIRVELDRIQRRWAQLPLTQAQAALPRVRVLLDHLTSAAIQLSVDNEQIIERLAGRAKAEGRADDTPESVRHRLNVYDQQTAPVIDFYREHGQLTVVDGVGSLDDVFSRIVEALAPVPEVG